VAETIHHKTTRSHTAHQRPVPCRADICSSVSFLKWELLSEYVASGHPNNSDHTNKNLHVTWYASALGNGCCKMNGLK